MPHSHYFFEINPNVWLLCAHLVMTSIILHNRRPNCQSKSVMHLVFMFQLIFFFRILRSWIARSSHRSISPHEVCTKEFQVLGGQKSCKELKWSNKRHIREVETSIMPIGNTIIHILSNVSEHINKLSFIPVLWIYSCNEQIWWQNYYFSTIIISNSQIEILVSYSRATKSQCKHVFS